MIEQIIINYLSAIVTACAEVPAEYPSGAFCVVEKTGGGRRETIKSARIAVQCYAATLAEAAALCERVADYMEGLTGLDAVARCALESSYNFTDAAQRHYRYQAVFDVAYY